MNFRHFGLAATLAATLALATPAHAVTEIQWWHAMTGGNNDVVNKLADDFNASQSDYKVVPSFKGSYADTMNAGIAAFRAGNAPHIMQVFEVGTATMMSATGAIKPVYQLMKDAGEPFDPKAYLPTITGYYSTSKGEMLSFPFNSSSMVMWINKDALKKAGIAEIPKTWPEVFDAAKKLKAAGHATCGFSNAWATWAHIEQFSAWHNVPIGTKANGLDGFDTVLKFNSTAARQASAKPDRPAEGQDLRLCRPRQRRRSPLRLGRMRDLPDFLGLLRDRKRHRQVRFHLGADALLSRCRRRAAELDHRRRIAVGDGRQEARGIQGRREILHVPVRHRPPGQAASGIRLSADHQGGLRKDQGGRLLRKDTRPGNAAEGTDQQGADREFARPALRQHGADARRLGRGNRSGACGAEDRPAGARRRVSRGNAMLRAFEKTAK